MDGQEKFRPDLESSGDYAALRRGADLSPLEGGHSPIVQEVSRLHFVLAALRVRRSGSARQVCARNVLS